MSKDNGGPAFPSENPLEFVTGMTLRDYFAAKFMCGRAAVPGFVDPSNDAEMAYRVADAMLKERAK